MKKIAIVVITATILAGCPPQQNNSSTDKKQSEQTEIIQDRLNSRLGLPNITNGQEKRLIKELYELRDQSDLSTYTYTYNEMTGEHRFLGRSIGFGIPASVQYSNPQKIAEKEYSGNGGYAYAILPQPEPNGLFMPEGLSATWVYLIDAAEGEAVPTYVEPTITVTMFPLANAVYPDGGPQYADLVAK